ncbi:MAG: hypothetical protein QOF46_1343, partial [Paraburkholderia sp.]|nr:hypothetical protein [Paraburkholderia sp.]
MAISCGIQYQHALALFVADPHGWDPILVKRY